jgi:hypothetical protein
LSRLMTRRVLKYFQQRCNKTTTFPNLKFKLYFRFGLERELVVHLGVGIHFADVVVVDQVHVTKFFNSEGNSTKTEVAFHVASRASI